MGAAAETPDGALALEGLGKIRQVSDRATALVAGPGLGTEKETHSLVREVCNFFDGPILLDADAIMPEIFEKLKSPQNLVITPHAGEFERLAPGSEAKDWSKQNPCILVLKGAHTQIFKGQRQINCLGGSSVLARGGSGDLLSGIMGVFLQKIFFHLKMLPALPCCGMDVPPKFLLVSMDRKRSEQPKF